MLLFDPFSYVLCFFLLLLFLNLAVATVQNVIQPFLLYQDLMALFLNFYFFLPFVVPLPFGYNLQVAKFL